MASDNQFFLDFPRMSRDSIEVAQQRFLQVISETYSGKWVLQLSPFRVDKHLISRDGVVAEIPYRQYPEFDEFRELVWAAARSLVPEEELSRKDAENEQYLAMTHFIATLEAGHGN